VGSQTPATGLDLGAYASGFAFVDKAAENGAALDPLPGEVGDGAVGRR
jgi:hypothetical protein